MNIYSCICTREPSPSFQRVEELERAGRHAFTEGISSGTVNQACNPYSVACARNTAVDRMLHSDATHLFFLDDDVRIQEDGIAILAGVDADIVLGCYPSTRGSSSGMRLYSPYITVMQNGEWLRGWFDGVREVDGGGTGCMLIRREVLERLGHPWFVWREIHHDLGIEQISDDMDFCRRAKEAGFSIKAHGNVRCGHIKPVDVASFILHESQPSINVTWCGPRTLIQQRSWPDFGSHVPALINIGESCEVKTVLEYGSGRYSTPVFLNRELYPDVERLVSFETDKHWFRETLRRNPDERLHLELRDLNELSESEVEDADVVFIDCDDQVAPGVHDFRERVRLLERHSRTSGIVVMHDANFPQLFPAIDKAPFKYKQMFEPLSGPSTAIMSNDIDITAINWRDIAPFQLAG